MADFVLALDPAIARALDELLRERFTGQVVLHIRGGQIEQMDHQVKHSVRAEGDRRRYPGPAGT